MPTAPRVLSSAALVIGAVIAAYHGSLSGEFALDDFSSVIENESIRRLDDLGATLRAPAEAGVGGRPLANLSFAVNYAISGLQPWSYRALNVSLHALSALLLLGIVRRTCLQPGFGAKPGAVATPLATGIAVLWAVHPLGTAAVNYASQRTELLMALCLLLTLYAFIRYSETGTRTWAALSIAACAGGMASKETMVAAPVLVWLYDRTFVTGAGLAAWRQRPGYYAALAATWLVLVGLILGSQLEDRGVGFGLGISATDYALTQSHALLLYLRLAAWPTPLVFDHGWWFVRSLGDAAPAFIGCIALLAATGVALWRRPAVGFCGAWVLGLLAPTTSFVPILQQPLAESRMYLPLAGGIALAVFFLWSLARRRSLFIATAAGTALALGVITARRHADYRTEISLWADTVAKRPANARAHGHLGAALLRVGRIEESYAASAQAVRLLPHYADAHNNLGIARDRAGRPADAIPHYEAALRIAPTDARAHYNLGNALAAVGRTSEAIAAFEAAIRHNPRLAEAHYNLGVLATRAGRRDEAVRKFEAALVARPDYTDAQRSLDRLRASR